MQCSKCKEGGIIFQPYSGQYLCRNHFISDLEAKAKRAIRVNLWMRPGDHIAVAHAGDYASEALLFFFKKLLANRRDVKISAVGTEDVIAGCQNRLQDSGVTKIALATTLEDAAASGLMDILRGNPGRRDDNANCTLPLITPFCHIPAEEIATYARIHGLTGTGHPLPQENDRLLTDVKAMLIDYSRRHPAAPHAVLNLCESLTHTCGQADEVSPHGA